MVLKSGVDKKTLTWVLSIGTLIFLVAISPSFYSSITGRATSATFGINITIGNNAPNIISVIYHSTIIPIEGSVSPVYINFTANDSDGFSNLQDSSAQAILTYELGGEPNRQNSSCIKLSNYGTAYANYSCTVYLNYFDASGSWKVNVSVQDVSNSLVENSTTNFTYSQLSAFVRGPANIAFPGITPGNTNVTATTSLTLNNTGNQPVTVGNIQLNATDLAGEIDSGKAIYASNFSVGTFTGSNAECDVSTGPNNATGLSHSLFVPLNLSTLPRGNNSLNYYNETSGQERVYFCIRKVGNELSSQSYSTAINGAWTIKII